MMVTMTFMLMIPAMIKMMVMMMMMMVQKPNMNSDYDHVTL